MADANVVKVKSKAKGKKSKKQNKKDTGWGIWSILGVSAAAIAAVGAGAYYFLTGEETATPSKTRKASDAI